MPWQQLKIHVKAEYAEAVGDMLTANAAQAVTFVDAKDTPMYEPKPGEVMLWPDTQVIGLYEAKFNLEPVIQRLSKAKLFQNEFLYTVDQLEDKDWTRAWMDDFHPMQFGNRLWICPSWRTAPDESAVNVLLDPGLAFGTGTHPTTSMCLKWLDGHILDNNSVIDFGCGSGVLAIAALKLGASEAIGIDIDPQALIASKANAEKNGVDSNLTLYLAEHQPKIQADVVVANILAGPLGELSDVISSHCKPRGWLIMSGILEEQAESVKKHYAHQFSFADDLIDGDWVRLVGQKKGN
ncbi:50S ribosomal protein L11 methyltransferase [Glaciecola sp. 1036]|uniref:50S ribosomal protein L11 methyltransferase n=1 Tax=Alteromonadaceae TaxID=72275 RepID=UPI003D05DDF4